MIKLKLDISEEGKDYQEVTDNEMLKRVLKKNELYREDLLFRGIGGERRIKDLMTRGSDHPLRNTIMAYNFKEAFKEGETTLFDFADYHPPGRRVIAVYDANKFIELNTIEADSEYVYRFKDPKNKKDSLVAIIEVKED